MTIKNKNIKKKTIKKKTIKKINKEVKDSLISLFKKYLEIQKIGSNTSMSSFGGGQNLNAFQNSAIIPLKTEIEQLKNKISKNKKLKIEEEPLTIEEINKLSNNDIKKFTIKQIKEILDVKNVDYKSRDSKNTLINYLFPSISQPQNLNNEVTEILEPVYIKEEDNNISIVETPTKTIISPNLQKIADEKIEEEQKRQDKLKEKITDVIGAAEAETKHVGRIKGINIKKISNYILYKCQVFNLYNKQKNIIKMNILILIHGLLIYLLN